MALQKVTTDNMAEIEAGGPALVEFSANWCVYCRRIEPALKRLSDRYAGRVTFGQVNIDDDPALEERFGVDTVPSLFAYDKQRGAWSEPLVAPSSEAEIDAFLRAHLEVNV
jgi:thioredoxin 1